MANGRDKNHDDENKHQSDPEPLSRKDQDSFREAYFPDVRNSLPPPPNPNRNNDDEDD